MFHEKSSQVFQNVFEFFSSLQPGGPSPARVENIPGWHAALMASFPRIVIPKTYDYLIPQWSESLDEKTFAQGNPNIIDGEIPAKEVIEFKI